MTNFEKFSPKAEIDMWTKKITQIEDHLKKNNRQKNPPLTYTYIHYLAVHQIYQEITTEGWYSSYWDEAVGYPRSSGWGNESLKAKLHQIYEFITQLEEEASRASLYDDTIRVSPDDVLLPDKQKTFK